MSDFERLFGVNLVVGVICFIVAFAALVVGAMAFVVYTGPTIVPSFGLAAHLAVSGASGAASTMGGVSWWLLSFATFGITLTGAAISIRLLVKLEPVAENKLYAWGMPVLAILSGFSIELCRDFAPSLFGNSEAGRTLFATFAALLFYMGGLLFKQRALPKKIAGVAAFAVGPAVIIYYNIATKHLTIHTLYQALDPFTLFGVGCLILLLIVATTLGYAYRTA